MGGCPLSRSSSEAEYRVLNTQDDYKFLATSEILEQILKCYRDGGVLGEHGFLVLSALIGKAGSLPKNNECVGLTFLLRLIPQLDKGDELFKKCRRLFPRTNPTLQTGGLGNLQFQQFFYDIIDEVNEGLKSLIGRNPIWPDLAAMTIYVGFLEKNSSELINDGSVHLKYESLVSTVDTILRENVHVLRIDLLRLLARLEKVTLKGEEPLKNLIKNRSR
ncbi:hypothetical protein POM88_003952 [Heracleum sosnowskyi]|uniref:Uncharacterized protein n=1 Tax=Heracleum sosnowskyi TaxID=360622 RepID=A0AAD8JH51_9APIA|nr:hypothetical protein POM88_003952 [Heracleum sosnowskyi]